MAGHSAFGEPSLRLFNLLEFETLDLDAGEQRAFDLGSGSEPAWIAEDCATIELTDHSISDPFQPSEPEELKPTLWMEIPKLPGEVEIERLRANEHRLRQNRSEID